MFPDALNAIVHVTLCIGILWCTARLDLARMSLCYLALPYIFFFLGWLNTPAAFILSSIFIFCIVKTLLATRSTRNDRITLHDVTGFLLILILVNLSGAGGYGYQTTDYKIHNARLFDLINYTWPVRYGENSNFVYYIGYFIPSAMLGKISSFDTALHSLYYWTVLGVTLAIRWLSFLTGWRFSAFLVVIFALFGPMDLFNVISIAAFSDTSVYDVYTHILADSDYLDFTISQHIKFFIGNYLSNTFQLFWSPHQVIAGWLCISLMTHAFLTKQFRQVFFIYALLTLWAPMVMIALFPFVLAIIITQLPANWRNLYTIENLLGAGSLATVFVIFYLAGSAGTNPSAWIINNSNLATRITPLLLFYTFGWGIYAIAIQSQIRKQGKDHKVWFSCLILTLALLPLRTFGEWADLLCRGSAPLMFLLLVYILIFLKQYWFDNRKIASVLLLCLLVPGMVSALLQMRTAVLHYGVNRPVASIITYSNAYPNLGPDNTLFERLLRRKLSE